MAPIALQRLNFAGFDFDDLLWAGQAPPLRPHLELEDVGEHYLLEAKVEGLAAEDLTIRVGPSFLEIEGHRVEKSIWPRLLCFVAAGERVLRFARRFPIVEGNPEDAQAYLVEGKLTVKVPKQGDSEFVEGRVIPIRPTAV
jgi:HSP20 family molecular chaperone IbpA